MRKGPFKANKKKLTGWPEAAAGHRNPALGLSPPYLFKRSKIHLVLQACSGRFPCKCGPRPLRAGRRRGSAPPTATPLGFQPCGRSSWVFRPWQDLVTKYPLSVAQRESPERVFLRLQAFRVFVFCFSSAGPPWGGVVSRFSRLAQWTNERAA